MTSASEKWQNQRKWQQTSISSYEMLWDVECFVRVHKYHQLMPSCNAYIFKWKTVLEENVSHLQTFLNPIRMAYRSIGIPNHIPAIRPEMNWIR